MRPDGLLIDVGCTLTFCDGETIAALAMEAGVAVAAPAIEAAEVQIRRELESHQWPSAEQSTAPPRGGVHFYQRLLALAGATGDLLRAAETIWEAHVRRNTWRRVGDGVREALAALDAAGIRMVAVSNSEGTVEQMLEDLGLRRHFVAVLDSWVVGIAKPDAGIFRLALERLALPPERTMMVGDSPSADVAGAAAVGIPAVLIDALDVHRDAQVPRFPDFSAFARFVLSG